MANTVAWHNKTLNEHVGLRDNAALSGYRFLSLSLYGTVDAPLYAAVMIKRPAVVAQRDWPALTTSQFQQTFNDQAAKGFGPVIISATGTASNPLFAAVFQPQNPIPLTRHLLGSGSVSDPTTIQGMNAQAKTQGLILHWAAAYGDSGNPRFAAIWAPNSTNRLWNADGISESHGDYQARFDAETSAWCRPAFVTLNKDQQYLSLFVDDEVVGSWVARHGLTAGGYQNEFNTWTGKGFFPACVQAAGSDGNSARFAAIFAASEETVPKNFNATGPVSNPAIDAVMKQAMQNSPIRHASLAIVHGTKLVYARGYTMAEPDWPLVQPTTCFRMASVSKVATALAIYQLIEAGSLSLSTKLQDVLSLKTPASAAPPDLNFKNITIQHLLEHKSGVDANSFRTATNVRNAFIAAGHPSILPVTAEQTDSYIAGLALATAPGATANYNNCGYYLLGRVVAKLRNKANVIDAYQQYLFNPLSITRIRRAHSLLANQPADEARYQDSALEVFPSQMSNNQPLVPFMYGTEGLEIEEGGGGLSGAATDIARLIAILISQKDSPALKLSTITSMLSGATTLRGYGLDSAQSLGGGKFYGQKGGALFTSYNVLEFNGDWGFALQWGALPAAAPADWYPNYPEVMNIAQTAVWADADLFPQFGMPSL